MSGPDYIPVATGVLYLGAALWYAKNGEVGPAIAYAGYAFANIGLILMAMHGR